MQTRHVARSGLVVSRTGLGTLTWGRGTDTQDAGELLDAFRNAGGTLVETAPWFGGGAAPSVLGSVIGAARDELVLAAQSGGASGLGRGSLLGQLDSLLNDLKTDHLDLWLLRGWSQQIACEEWLAVADLAVNTGRVRYAGLTGVAAWQVTRAARGGRVPLVALQAENSLLLPLAPDTEAAAADAGLGLITRAPLGRGILAGRSLQRPPAESRGASGPWDAYLLPALARPEVVEAVVTAADGLGVAPVEVALAWARDRPNVASVVVGARTTGQLHGSLNAETLTLPAEIRTALNDVALPPAPPDDSPPFQ